MDLKESETMNDREIVTPAVKMTRVRNSLTRHFSYKLTDKKATANFIKSASKEPLEIDQKQKCTIFTFSIGAYVKCVFPLLKSLEGETIKSINNTIDIRPLKFLPGCDEMGKQIDLVASFLVNSKKVTLSCFHTTQKIKVEGNNYNEFVNKYLRKQFTDSINVHAEEIDDYNKGVIATLSGKRKVVSRPVRSVRFKSTTE